MATGRIADAVEYYAKARRGAKSGLLTDTGQSVLLDVLTTELEVERVGHADWERLHPMPTLAGERRDAVRLRCRGRSARCAANGRRRPGESAGRSGRGRHVRCQGPASRRCRDASRRCAFRCSSWRDEPRRRNGHGPIRGCPTPMATSRPWTVLTWREMEAVSCARLRLLTGQSRFDGARELAEALLLTSRQKGLRRTEMRGTGPGDRSRACRGFPRTCPRAASSSTWNCTGKRRTPNPCCRSAASCSTSLEGRTNGSKEACEVRRSRSANCSGTSPPIDGGPVYALTPRERQVLGLSRTLAEQGNRVQRWG